MDGKPSFISLAIWEHAYDMESTSFDTLLVNKAKYLQKLKAIDLFDMPEADAVKMSNRIDFLSEEITTMYSFKVFTATMRIQYMETMDKMQASYSVELTKRSEDVKSLTMDYEFLNYLYQQSLESIEFLSGQLMSRVENQLNYHNG
jgi:hypothetical protein